MCAQRSSLNAPQPHKTISCQQLLQEDVSHSGWLRKRSRIHKSIKLVGKLIPWMNKYIVLSKGCMYVFDSESSKKPCTAFTLHGYNNVNRAGEVAHTEAPWSFKLMPVDLNEERVRFFSASSEREMKTWMVEIKKQMMFANGQGCRISHKRLGGRSLSQDEGDQSISYSDIEDDVYQRANEVKLSPIDDVESGESDEEQEGYHEIEEWMEQGHDTRRNMPLPLPPRADSTASPIKSKQPPLTKSRSDAGADVNKPFPMATPDRKPASRKPPLPLHPPDDDEFDSEPKSPTSFPQPASPTRADVPPSRSGSSAQSGTVDALKKQFDNKPVIAPRPGAQKVLPVLPQKSKANVKEPPSPSAAKGDSRPPQPLPVHRDRPVLPPHPGVRAGPEGTDNPEQDYLDDIFWKGDKEEANQVLNDAGEEGVYLIRSSEDGVKVLVVYAEGGARKYRIQQSDGQVYIASDLKFDTIQAMLDFYHTTELPKRGTMLTRPYNR